MCGIFGFIGIDTDPGQIVLDGLKKLEYRGYDSFGIAITTKQKFIIHKQTGEIEHSTNPFIKAETNFAIGHSRWATHGGVTKENAHPHVSNNEQIMLVHNGIFENYLEIKKQLESKGYSFYSQTDSEVAAVLLEDLTKTLNPLEALSQLNKTLKGRYAMVIKFLNDNNLYAIRNGSPIIIGNNLENKQIYIASDIPAFLNHTNNVTYLDDNQLAVLTLNGQEISTRFFNLESLQQNLKDRL